MKMMGFVIIIIGLIMVYVGITGNQHNLMAVITGKSSGVPAGRAINPAGINAPPLKTKAASKSNSNPGGEVAV